MNTEYYYEYLKTILHRWTHETERSIWAGHYESEKTRIDLCFNIANEKAREVYQINKYSPITAPVPEVELTPEPIVEPEVILEEPIFEPETKKDKVGNIKKWMKSNFPDFTDQPVELPIKLRIEENKLKNTLSTPILSLSLSSHIHNKLHANNIKTLEELLSLNQTQIEKILYFSETNLLELILELNKLDIKHSFVLSKNILAEILPNATITKQKSTPKPTPIIEPVWNTPWKHFFTPTIFRHLEKGGITSLDQLLSKSTEDVLSIQQLGARNLQFIIEQLDLDGIKHGFYLPSPEEIKEIKAKSAH